MSGKLGRPPEDRLARQQEIYEAVSPLILGRGVRHLSLRAAAHAACLSLGGLYHYFPTKRELVLHGAQQATLMRYCSDFLGAIAPLAASDPARYLDAYCDHAVQLIIFMRPSFQAALELGAETVRATLEENLEGGLMGFVAALRTFGSGIDEDALAATARAIRRVCLGALLDATTTGDELHRQVRLLVEGYTAA
jgi:AcrR family transcriptional regulator